MFGFRGLGYSPDFVANMKAVADAFFSHPGVEVDVVSGCDDICRACPHVRNGACGIREGSEASVRAKDELILAKLKVVVGDKCSSSFLARRAIESISPDALADICAGCQWLPAGYCQEGLGWARDGLLAAPARLDRRPHQSGREV
jgi:hypothetical protein